MKAGASRPTTRSGAPAAVVGTSAREKTYVKGYQVRTGPGTKYGSLGLILKYDGVEVRCKARTAGWMRVYVLNGQREGRTGWTAGKYIHD
ncbi:hypothetical protein D9753_35320 [Streptomyces dangxiongensis]|uniref:SH3b domain-containing protein n=1 Tax=Streptomyces dangxiongensis TaxID=1442032 RepID=A0A3G2JRE6_9ACTN|nr:SH3 domain-containing protein [Streptomyces dangxiongensis]AYN43277.1 hypothetical protein D9753_35320 [Streptomyces dangxiongensis]